MHEPKCAERLTVNQHMIRFAAKPARHTSQRPAHGEHRGVVDVDLVDLAGTGGTERNHEGLLADAGSEHHAGGGVELFGVVHAGDSTASGRHHDRACDNGARKRAPSDFIHTHQERPVQRTQGALDRSPPSHVGRLCAET